MEIAIHGVVLEQSKSGLVAIMRHYPDDATLDRLSSFAISSIVINVAKGWGGGSDISFLLRFPELTALEIVLGGTVDISIIEKLVHLRELDLQVGGTQKVELGHLDQMRKCSILWRPGRESILKCISLNELYVINGGSLKLSTLSNLSQLMRLGIFQSKIDSLVDLRLLSSLRYLRLSSFPFLTTLQPIGSLEFLEHLFLQSCTRIRSLSELSTSKSLKTVSIWDCGQIDSLKPLITLRQLRSLSFPGSTNIVDGDIGVLAAFTHLEKISFQNRRHYSHKVQHISSLIKGRGLNTGI